MSSPPTVRTDASSSLETTEEQLRIARARLQESLAALEQRFVELKDWRAWYRKRPVGFLAAAMVLGALVGLGLGGPRPRARRPR